MCVREAQSEVRVYVMKWDASYATPSATIASTAAIARMSLTRRTCAAACIIFTILLATVLMLTREAEREGLTDD